MAYRAHLLLAQITPALQFKEKIHCQHRNIPIWAFSKRSVSVSTSYCLPLARAETNLPPAAAPGLAGNQGLELRRETGTGKTHQVPTTFALMNQPHIDTTLGFRLHVLSHLMLKEEGFLSDQISKLKPSKSERWLPPAALY